MLSKLTFVNKHFGTFITLVGLVAMTVHMPFQGNGGV